MDVRDFWAFLSGNRLARRVFGKRELEIIFKQLRGLPLTQSEANRLSRDVKPKLEFVSQAAGFKEFFSLEKNALLKETLAEGVKAVLEDEAADDVEAVLLAGSFFSGEATPRSDVDLIVVFRRRLDLREATLFRKRLLSLLPERIDVQVFSALPPRVRASVAANHKVVYSQKGFSDVLFSLREWKKSAEESLGGAAL